MSLNARRITIIGAVLAAALSLVTGLSLSALGGSAGAAAPTQPLLFDGVSPSGREIVATKLIALPPTPDSVAVGDKFPVLPVRAQLARSGDKFSVLVDPEALPGRAVGAGGIVDYFAYIKDDAGSWFVTTFSARGVRPIGQSKMRWLDPIDSSWLVTETAASEGFPAVGSPSAARLARARTAAVEADPTYDYDDESIDVPEPTYREVAAPPDCLETTYKGDSNRSTTIATSYPIGTTVSKLKHTTTESSEGKFGVAGSTNGGSSWYANGTRYASGSWTGTWAYSGLMRSYRIWVNYHHMVLGDGCSGEYNYREPHIEIGGAGTNTSGMSRPNWSTYCGNQPRNFEFERIEESGYAYSYGAAVKFKSVIGIDLYGKKAYNSGNVLYYRFSGQTGDPLHKLCGKDDYPSMASKMIDRYR